MSISIYAYLKAKYIEYGESIGRVLDSREGLAVTELFMKPIAFLMQPLRDEIDATKANQSIENYATMSEDSMDSLMKNVFVERIEGYKSVGPVRIYLFEPQDTFLVISTIFISQQGYKFYSTASVNKTREEVMLQREGAYYYVDANVIAELEGIEYNVLAAEIITMEGASTNVVKVENLSDFTMGLNRDTNTELYEKAQKSITVRDLVTGDGIATILPQNFPYIAGLNEVGHGDIEMKRDIEYGIHIGSHGDIWLQTIKFTDETEDFFSVPALSGGHYPAIYVQETPDTGNEDFTITNIPLMYLTSVQLLDPLDETQVLRDLEGVKGYGEGAYGEGEYGRGVYEFILFVINPEVRYSMKEKLVIRLDTDLIGFSVRVNYKYDSKISEIQTFIESKLKRVIVADLLARSFVPGYVVLPITYRVPAGTTITNAEMTVLVENMITNLATEKKLEVSDVLDLLYDNGADYVRLPVTAQAYVHHVNESIELLESVDFLYPTTDASVPSSPRIVKFYPLVITLTRI